MEQPTKLPYLFIHFIIATGQTQLVSAQEKKQKTIITEIN